MAVRAFGPLILGERDADDPRTFRLVRKRPTSFLADFLERSHGGAALVADPDRTSKHFGDHVEHAYNEKNLYSQMAREEH